MTAASDAALARVRAGRNPVYSTVKPPAVDPVIEAVRQAIRAEIKPVIEQLDRLLAARSR